MAFQQKDLKILWGKAAGICSMPDCRKKLVADASEAVSSKAILLGENCHIVAESEGGPRGESDLCETDRNRYPNLILLCANHHTIIDQDPSSWSIEKLHQIKADHEIWVETQLTDINMSSSDELYSQLVNSATENLYLHNWEAISDHAIRGLLFNNFVEGAGRFSTVVFKTIWPGDIVDLELAIKNLAQRVDAYIKHFISLGYLRNDNVWVEDKRWKKTWRKDFDLYAEMSKKWEQTAVNLLANIVVALNEFSNAVRATLNPDYFLLQGKFTLYDSIGVTNELQEIHYMPSEYIAIES